MKYEILWVGSSEWRPIRYWTLIFLLDKIGWTPYHRDSLLQAMTQRSVMIFREFKFRMSK